MSNIPVENGLIFTLNLNVISSFESTNPVGPSYKCTLHGDPAGCVIHFVIQSGLTVTELVFCCQQNIVYNLLDRPVELMTQTDLKMA